MNLVLRVLVWISVMDLAVTFIGHSPLFLKEKEAEE